MANMNPNVENLKPIRDSETARKLQQKSSKKQKENHQKRLLFKSEIEKQIGVPLKGIISKAIEKALDGDIKSMEFLRDTMGEKPTDKVETNIQLSYEDKLKEMTDEDED